MTAPASGGATARITAWLRTHQKQAAIGAGVVGVGGIALYTRSHSASSTAADTTATNTGNGSLLGTGADTTDGGTDYTGSSDTGTDSSGDTTGDDIASLIGGLSDSLGSIQGDLDTISTNTTPTKPGTPKKSQPSPIPTPGHDTFVVKHGSTLKGIAEHVYGTDAAWAISDLKKANPILRTFSPTASLQHFGGTTIKITSATPPKKPAPKPVAPKPAPKAPAPKKPAPKAPAPKKPAPKAPAPKKK